MVPAVAVHEVKSEKPAVNATQDTTADKKELTKLLAVVNATASPIQSDV